MERMQKVVHRRNLDRLIMGDCLVVGMLLLGGMLMAGGILYLAFLGFVYLAADHLNYGHFPY